MPPPLRHLSRKPRYSGGSARHIEFGIPQIYSRISDRFRRIRVVAERPGEGPFTILFADLRYCASPAGGLLSSRQRPGEPPEAQPDGGEGNEGSQGFGEVLEVLGETPVSVVYFVIVAPDKFIMARQGKVVFGDPPATKTCPACLSDDLNPAASKCEHCGSAVNV
jgi:hypothetical protein